ncbi:hypothetical protein [Streptomyces sp. CBMA156]|uniref:hypothetical protein n=1 Tax=Streptomyces sp. CBMA156 TaxID=1930280 RepID=UPI001661C755|nr:hypothetical protein [Streptomyces sp. CBMA156]MBD0674929.1 hypothetical protein [Streptomyces sp. CBMA156]
MRNGLVQLGAWAAATGAAVALSWLGVHTVLTGAAFEQPTALPLPSAKADGTPHPAPPATEQPRSATQSTTPSPAASPTTATATTTAATAPHGPAPGPTAATPTRRPSPTATATSTVKSYPIPGGKVALDLKPDRATLVSATPDPGWQMQVWTDGQWLRVDFTRGDEANSVIASWNGHAPMVQTVVR